jgi:hypothetical protein
VHEVASALLIGGGPVALTAATALFSALAAVLFALLLRRLGVRAALVGGLALALTPIVYIASTEAMDYLWALAFVLAAYLAVLRERPLAAGVLLGLAVGCRLTSGAFLLPLALIAWERWPAGRRPRDLPLFAGGTLVVAGLCFAPVLLKHGLKFWTYYYSGYPTLDLLLSRATLEVWGILGCVALLAGITGAVVARFGAPKPLRALDAGPLSVAAWVLTIGLFIFAYLRLPYEAAYLIPTVPMVLLLLARFSPPALFRGVCLALLPAAFIGGMPTDARWGRAPGWERVEQPAIQDFARGPIFQRHDRRLAFIRYTEQTLFVAGRLPRPSIILSESWLPYVEEYVPSAQVGNARFVYLLKPDELLQKRREGYDLYFLPFAWDATRRIHHVDLRDYGAAPLPL